MNVMRKKSAWCFRYVLAGAVAACMLTGCAQAASSDAKVMEGESATKEEGKLTKTIPKRTKDTGEVSTTEADESTLPASEEETSASDLQENDAPEEENQASGEEMSEAAYDDLVSYLGEVIEMGQIPSYEGMDMLADGSWEEVFGYPCAYIRLGTNHDENFVTEHHVYVAQYGAVFEYDVVTDTYRGMDIPGQIFCDGWAPDTLSAVITDPYSNEAMWYYAAQPEEGNMAIVAMQEGVSIRLEKVHVDWDTYQTVADETVLQERNMPCGAAVYWIIPMAETIPEYRIVAEYKGKEAVWDAIYDGENGDTIQYMHVTED